ncbi:MAG: amino acid ABC transporter permease [Ruminococcaceae bacterium]|nr:amino acid ABC transporter permease [Oscillospiraceae bacterium]
MDFTTITLKLLEGFKVSFWLFALTLIFSLPLGLIISFGSMSRFKPVSWLVRVFVWIIRGTPLMLQLFVVFYVPDLVFPVKTFSGEHGRFFAALVAFVINYACYFSEIFRGGIQGVPKGQYEAAQVLGMTAKETFFTVVLMQVVKRILAPISNEVITLVKDTSLARTIAVAEIFYINQTEFLSKSLIWPMFYIAVFFLVFVGLLTLFFGWCEKKLSYYRV